jgi:hypothetical protein
LLGFFFLFFFLSFFLPPFYEAFLLSLFREESSASDMDWRKAKESLKGCSQAPPKEEKGQKDNQRIKAKRKKARRGNKSKADSIYLIFWITYA